MLTWGGGATAQTRQARTQQAASATQVLASSISLLESQEAVHYVSMSVQSGTTTKVTGDAGRVWVDDQRDVLHGVAYPRMPSSSTA